MTSEPPLWLGRSKGRVRADEGVTVQHLRLIALTLVLALVANSSWAIERASIIVDADTGKVLHAVDPDAHAYPDSLTKLMTLYLTFQALQSHRITMDQKLPVSARAASRAPSKLGVRRGQTITVRQAISALVTKSANDVATVLGEALGKTEPRFAEMMTAKAHQLGMMRTTFRNASGLPDRSQVTTARDMVKLALALQRDVFGHLPGTGRWATVLLADGNIGIGGDPGALLRRSRSLLKPGGTIVAEIEPPGAQLRREHVRLRTPDRSGAWFPWAWVGVDQIAAMADSSALQVARVWADAGRWFTELRRCPGRPGRAPG